MTVSIPPSLLTVLAVAMAAVLLWLWLRGAAHQRAVRALRAENTRLRLRVDAQGVELRDSIEQMRQARDTAEAADLAKTRFLAAASHDLRQPAHALGLYAAALCAGPLAPEQAEIAQRMQASLTALDAMFGALLDVSRIDAGAVVPRWDTVALAPLLHRLADEWAGPAEAAGLRLAVHVADSQAATVSDPQMLERVLRNLLSNAVKYTRQGGVLLACRTRTAADGTRAHRIEVWDSGIGIAPAERERVFEEFFQAGNAARDRRSGLGLGLAIAQRVAWLLQLRVTLHSRPGRGSVFFVDGLTPAGTLPLRAAAARQQTRRLQGLNVAVLEDDAEVRDAMRRLLQQWGCRSVEASDAAALLDQWPPGAVAHAVVADVRLPAGRHGPDEAHALCAAWGRKLPLLLVSGETAPDTLKALQALDGARQLVLTKPVSPARLRAWLEQQAASALPQELP